MCIIAMSHQQIHIKCACFTNIIIVIIISVIVVLYCQRRFVKEEVHAWCMQDDDW